MTKDEFTPGIRVSWESTSQGSTVGKSGEAIAVIHPSDIPCEVYPVLKDVSSSCIKLGSGIHGRSSCDRLLVRVDRKGVKGESLKPWFYAPRLSVVRIKEGK